MHLQLTGKRALVTGSSSGIGAEIAKTLAGEGAWVTVHGRNLERAQAVAEEIRKAGGQAFVAAGDLTDDAQALGVVERALQAMGGVDILVNNAGGAEGAPTLWGTGTLNDWRRTFEQNLFGSMRVLLALLPHLRSRGWGRVVQIATSFATQPDKVAVDYAASKAGLLNTSVGLAKELAGTGVTVNTVSPGPILTPALERVARGLAQQRGWGQEWEEIEARLVEQIAPNPTGRIGRVQDIATAVAFLASPLAGFINGANLRVDGGCVTSTN